MSRLRSWRRRLIFMTLAVVCGAAGAQPYPTRNITILAPVAAGSPFDLLTRLFAEQLRQKTGVGVMVENATGGSGLIATRRAMSAKSDGYTLLLASGGLNTSPLVVKNAGYQAQDFVPIAALGQVPYILFVSSAVPATDIPTLMAYLRSNGRNLNYGVLSTSHLSMLLARKFGAAAGVPLTEIAYRGSAEMTTSLLSSDIQLMATTYSVAGPHLASGRLRAIGVVAEERTQKMADLPTFKEKGYPALYTSVWASLFAKADMPAEILAKIRALSQEIVTDPAYLKAMEPTGMEPWPVPFDQLRALMDAETKEFEADAKQFNLKFD